MVERVIATPAALELIEQLKAGHGPDLIFHQSGGCCDNSAANCYLPTDLTIGPYDVHPPSLARRHRFAWTPARSLPRSPRCS